MTGGPQDSSFERDYRNLKKTVGQILNRPNLSPRLIALEAPGAHVTPITTINFTDAYSTFPVGVSYGQVGTGWPTSTATVITVNVSSQRAFQMMVDKTTGRTYTRGADSSGTNGWDALVELFSESTPKVAYASASGSGSYTTAAIASLGNANVTITFPASRFSVAPNVFAMTGSGRLSTGYSSLTSTGFVLSMSNWSTASAGTPIAYDWHAEQMTSSSANG